MVDTTILKKIPLFEGLSDGQLEKLRGLMREKEVIMGDYIFDEGAQATSMFIVRQGTVEILKKGTSGDEQRVASITSGSIFGEMAFLDRAARAASALCRENVKLIELPYEALEKLFGEDKEIGLKLYRTFAQTLCRRIRNTTIDLSALRELKLRHS